MYDREVMHPGCNECGCRSQVTSVPHSHKSLEGITATHTYTAYGECFAMNHVKTVLMYEGWNFNSGNYLFTTDTK